MKGFIKGIDSTDWELHNLKLFANFILPSPLTTLYIFCKAVLVFNPLNPELNPICYLLALLGAHHFLYVSRIRVKD